MQATVAASLMSLRIKKHNRRKGVSTYSDIVLLNNDNGSEHHQRAFSTSRHDTLTEPRLHIKAIYQSHNQYGGLTELDGDGVMVVIFFGSLSVFKLKKDFVHRHFETGSPVAACHRSLQQL